LWNKTLFGPRFWKKAPPQQEEQKMVEEQYTFLKAIELMGDWVAYLEDVRRESEEAGLEESEPAEMIEFFERQIRAIVLAMPPSGEA